MAGRFIVFEGVDSEAIADQARRMAEWLRSEGMAAVTTREPTDGPIGSQIRLVLNGRLQVDEMTLAVLFLADRLDHLHRGDNGILAELQRDRTVVCVRYLLSAYAYQSDIVDLQWLKQINQPCPWPNLTIFVDTLVERSIHQLVQREGYDTEGVEQRSRELGETRDSYLRAIEQCKLDGKEVTVVDGNQPPTAIHQRCRSLVERLFEG
jgi:dTMP kinase